MFKRIVAALVALIMVWNGFPSQAQGIELLQNPSFDTLSGTNPVNWGLNSSIPIASSGHKWPGESRTGASWDLSTTSRAFSATAFQFVPGVKSGTKLRLTAWANVFTCNKANSCIEGNSGHRVSDKTSGAKTRIGIDPTGNQDPHSGAIVWSDFIAPYDDFQQMIVDTESKNDNGVTVFLFVDLPTPMLLNHAYWDDASLQAVGPGGVPVAPGAPQPTAAPQYAPLVKPQGTQSDGSIIHVVQAGDTLSSIAYAYKVTVQQIRDLNKMSPDDYLLQVGQKLLIKKADKAAATAQATPWYAATSDVAAAPTATQEPPTATSVATQPPEGPATKSSVPNGNHPTDPFDIPLQARAGGDGAQIPDPAIVLKTDTRLCVTTFEDTNTNRWRDSGEPLLPGVNLKLAQNGQAIKSLTTSADGPACFDGIAPGTYVMLAIPPSDYGLTTSGELEVEARPGSQLALTFGAANGYHAAVPNAEALANQLPPPSSTAQQDKLTSVIDTMFSNIGLIVLGLAGLVLAGGLGTVFLIRRR